MPPTLSGLDAKSGRASGFVQHRLAADLATPCLLTFFSFSAIRLDELPD
jgi:hypothetical protein